MKILLLGSDGMLGHVVKIYFTEKGDEVLPTTRRDVNSEYYYDADKDIERIIFFNKS